VLSFPRGSPGGEKNTGGANRKGRGLFLVVTEVFVVGDKKKSHTDQTGGKRARALKRGGFLNGCSGKEGMEKKNRPSKKTP